MKPLLTVLAILLAATPAMAIPITGGTATIGTSNFGLINIFGPGFSLNAIIDDAGVFTCQTCLPGPQFLDTHLGAGDLRGPTVVLDGVTYSPVWLQDAFLTFQGTWMAPATGGPTNLSVIVPFAFSGSVTPSLTSGSIDLTGSGTATINLVSGPLAYSRQSIRYDFTPAPEPTTVALVVSALGVLTATRHRRQRREVSA
jgi:hypothetical protein